MALMLMLSGICWPGGWTVIQKRDGESNLTNPDFFYKTFRAYEDGFGNVNGDEFWLGNQKNYALTLQEPMYLQIQLEDWEGQTKSGETGAFRVLSAPRFEVVYDGISEELGTDFPKSGSIFSTYDFENPNIVKYGSVLANQANQYKGGWWYDAQLNHSNLNGLNLKGKHFTEGDGINWKSFRGVHYSLKTTKMRIRPLSMKN